MNIIGNSCASSYVTRDLLHERFSNPFTWCSVTEADMLYVIKNFNKINWNCAAFEIYDDNHTTNAKCVKVIVDSSFEIKYPHYCLSNSQLKINGINVYADNIVEWVKLKYNSRIERMKTAGRPFYCIGGTWEDQKMSLSTKKLLNQKRDVIILSDETIKHDNYKIAVNNFGNLLPILNKFYNISSKDPSSKST